MYLIILSSLNVFHSTIYDSKHTKSDVYINMLKLGQVIHKLHALACR